MIKGIQISDATGVPFYTKIGPSIGDFESTILSGLISAIGNMSNVLFQKEVASISFGSGANTNNIFIISKEIHDTRKKIYFVFFVDGQEDIKILRRMATTIFIHTKEILKHKSSEFRYISTRIDKVFSSQFAEL
ncbi:MAG: hypothetical protein ACTSUK_00655, partial [Promethearchaeota archaeon]